MKHWMKLCAVAFIAAGAMWIAISPQTTPQVDAAPQIIVKDEPVADPIPLQRAEGDARESSGSRNLFAYVEHQEVRESALPPVVVEKVEEPAPAPVAAVIAQEKPRPQFPYRYIGRFGHDANPIAAFVRDGEVVTVHAGERIGVFRVRSIDRESVDIEADGEIIRVRL